MIWDLKTTEMYCLGFGGQESKARCAQGHAGCAGPREVPSCHSSSRGSWFRVLGLLSSGRVTLSPVCSHGLPFGMSPVCLFLRILVTGCGAHPNPG